MGSLPDRERIGEEMKAVLLVGGMGTRLRSVVPAAPKPLALVGNQSFLELLVRQLRCQGVRRLIMCTGYLAGQIEKKFADGRPWDVSIEYAREMRPLGTAGAVGLARQYLQHVSEFLVMNGDSFLEVDFGQLVRFHREHRATVSMAVRRVENASRYGTVHLDAAGKVTGFIEKVDRIASGLVNAGVYVFDQAIFEHIPKGTASLEKDVFPRLISSGLYALEESGMFIDIGTPEDYARAQHLWGPLCEAALHGQTGSE